ncbi:methionine adenosyltransferase domain-containing protein [Candidatus Uhrbacteria bacterium]|nr:methionine adenosyltransferase domain-containing protein [Candidatus Uhrbacteria bacterium]
MLKVVEAPLAGHPDKMCDQIVEAIVDEYLRRDPLSRLDLQALGSHGMVMIGGVVDSRADFDAADLVRRVYATIGYDDGVEPFVNAERPTEDVARAIVQGGAQGTTVVHGYATRETREFLPRPVVYANALARRVDDLRRTDPLFSWLRPDGKVQVAMDGERIVSVTLIVEHNESLELPQVQALLLEHAITPVCGAHDGMKLYVNPSGKFTNGGFAAGVGVSGRKVLADSYGGLLPHGGASLAGKDPLKSARAGSYMARAVAKQLVREGAAGNVLVTIGYTTGINEPTLLSARGGAGEDLTDVIKARFDFRPEAVVERLRLRQPWYEATAVFGQFGREGLPWEDRLDA